MSKKTSKRKGIVANARDKTSRFAMLEVFLQLAKSAVELLTAIAKYLSVKKYPGLFGGRGNAENRSDLS